MRTVIKNIISRTYKPMLERYLSRARTYEQDGIRLRIPPEVFHPAFFSSTQFLLERILSLPLKGKRLLELGAGSGLISMLTARRGSSVVASEINTIGVEYLAINSSANGIGIEIRESDLFQKIPVEIFDIIAINPPYYKKDPANQKQLAWYCGAEGEYFFRLFDQLPAYFNNDSVVLMVLCDGCDREMIGRAATKSGLCLIELESQQSWIERNFIYQVKKVRPLD